MSLDSLEYINESKINGCNLYVYCNNDPVNNIDITGNNPIVLPALIEILKYIVIIVGTFVVADTISGSIGKNPSIPEFDFEETFNSLTELYLYSIKWLKEYMDSLEEKRKNDKREKHHIVPRGSTRTFEARFILKVLCDIDINDKRYNIAEVREPIHRVMHTNAYYDFINCSIMAAYGLGGKNGVKLILKMYKRVLESA